jgi:glutathione synthase/RimK-type ligase-like ATP-grasp enzyme
MSVLIVGNPEAYHELKWLQDEVEQRGAETVFVEPQLGEQNFSSRIGESTYTIGAEIDLQRLTGAFFEFVTLFNIYHSKDLHEWYREEPVRAARIRKEHQSIFSSLFTRLERMEGVNVISPPHNQCWHSLRSVQLSMFDDHGIPVPDTIVTNDHRRVQEFASKHDDIVYKPVNKGTDPTRITGEELLKNLQDLENCPVMFQEYVPGTDIRAYVVDGEFVCSYGYDHSTWSFKVSNDDTTYHKYEPSSRQLRDIERAATLTGLRYAAIDLRVDGDKYVFIEINAGGRFGVPDDYFDNKPVSSAIASYLT